MRQADIRALIENRKIKFEQLISFWFSEGKNAYTYSTSLVDGQFEMIVTVTKEGDASAEIIDTFSREPYVLYRVSDVQGEFVGRVREESKGILTAIADVCFEPDIFKSEQAGQVIRYVREKYRDELQFLWKRFPNNAIYRRMDNAKWYAALLTVQKTKLGLNGDETVEIIDLRGKPADIEALLDNGEKYLPGYHMNKKHWFSICLNGSVPVEEIFHRIDASFVLAAKR